MTDGEPIQHGLRRIFQMRIKVFSAIMYKDNSLNSLVDDNDDGGGMRMVIIKLET